MSSRIASSSSCQTIPPLPFITFGGVPASEDVFKKEAARTRLLAEADQIGARQAGSRRASVAHEIPRPANLTDVVIGKNTFGKGFSDRP